MSPLFPIVGIGASAGGLEAFIELLKSLPSDTGMAFVFVQHLDPAHQSLLTEIISKVTKMPTVEVKNRMPVLPDHVYIIPPQKDMIFSGEKFSLISRREVRGGHLPIDTFFMSLAKFKNHQAIGVILSGSGSDGVNGQKAIRFNGGVTICQSPSTALQESMPKSAIAAGCVDYILRPKAIAVKLANLSRHLLLIETNKDKIDRLLLPVKDDFQRIFILLKYFSGVDFSFYKKATIVRRIERRMALTRKGSLKEYLKLLRTEPKEVEDLFQDLLISVTGFFRDKKVFKVLQQKIFHKILTDQKSDQPLRFWVPACSTGEEAYSFAICLAEAMRALAVDRAFQIFATDVNEAVIRKARRGLYPESIRENVPAEILNRYFTREKGGWRIIKPVRDRCVFAVQDLTRDPPFSKLDLISCRNMFIYMDRELQKKIISLFHYALNSSGFLILGSAESIFSFSDLFCAVDKRLRIYSKKETAKRALMRFEPSILPPVARINPDHDLSSVHHGQLTAFDTGSEDAQARDEELRSALEEIQSANEELQSSNEELETSKEELQATNEEMLTLNEELSNRNAELGRLTSDMMNLFNSTRLPVVMVGMDMCIHRFTPMAQKVWNLIPSDVGRRLSDINPNLKISFLNESIKDAVDHLKVTEQEVQDNEGRWYSMTVSPYKTLDNKIDGAVITLADIDTIKKAGQQLEAAGAYFENIVRAVPDPLIMLDKSLRVRTANAAFYDQFKCAPEDTEGSLIYDLGNRQWNIPKLRKLLKEVISKNNPVMDFELTRKFPRIGERTMLLNAAITIRDIAGDHLILLAIKDITQSKISQEILLKENSFRSAIIENQPGMVWLKDKNGKFLAVNSKFAYACGLRNAQELIGKTDLDVWPAGLARKYRADDARVMRTKKPLIVEEWIEDKSVQKVFETFKMPVIGPDSRVLGTSGFAQDITERKRSEESLKSSEQRFRNIIENAPEPIFTHLNKKFTFLNRAALKAFGAESQEELIGRPVMGRIHADSRAIVKKRMGITNAAPHAVLPLIEEKYLKLDGSVMDVEVTAISFDHQKQYGSLVFFRDITERKKVEQRIEDDSHYIQTLLSASPVAIFTYKAGGETVSVNEAAAKLVGTTVDNLKKQNFRHLRSWKESGLLKSAIQALETGKEMTLEVSGISSYGNKLCIFCRFVPFYFGDQQHLLLMATDISERKKNEEMLRVAKLQAEAANKYKTEFLMNISHDLRTPINSILGFAHILQSVQLDEKYRKCVDFINERSAHLMGLVDEILDVSKLDSGSISLKSDEFEMRQLLQNSIGSFSILLGQKDVRIVSSVEEKIPRLKGDAVRVQQIIDNLLGNAVKYTAKGTIKLTVKIGAQPSDQSKCRLVISVKDTGFGIPSEQLPYIFDSFARFHEYYQGQKYEGSGLGLHIVRKLVDLMGGEIGVTSVVNEGSEFIVILNLDKV